MDNSNQRYNNSCVVYESNDTVDSKGAEISFVNVGAGKDPITGLYSGANVRVLGFTLYPGQGVSFDGNRKEFDVTKYQFYFISAGIRNLAVFQKNFV